MVEDIDLDASSEAVSDAKDILLFFRPDCSEIPRAGRGVQPSSRSSLLRSNLGIEVERRPCAWSAAAAGLTGSFENGKSCEAGDVPLTPRLMDPINCPRNFLPPSKAAVAVAAPGTSLDRRSSSPWRSELVLELALVVDIIAERETIDSHSALSMANSVS